MVRDRELLDNVEINFIRLGEAKSKPNEPYDVRHEEIGQEE